MWCHCLFVCTVCASCEEGCFGAKSFLGRARGEKIEGWRLEDIFENFEKSVSAVALSMCRTDMVISYERKDLRADSRVFLWKLAIRYAPFSIEDLGMMQTHPEIPSISRLDCSPGLQRYPDQWVAVGGMLQPHGVSRLQY